MLLLATVLAALAIIVGIVGVVVPVLPGLLVVVAAVFVWALAVQHGVAWAVFIVSAALAVAGWGLQYVIPGRRLHRDGIPNRTTIIGLVVGIVGFFVLPPIGLPLGFVLGVYLAELRRLRSAQAAWPSAVRAIKAAMLSFGIELTTAWLIAAAFALGAWALLSGAVRA